MQDSSDQQNIIQQYYRDNPNDSHNETAVSIQQNQNDLQAQDEDQYAQEVLKQFYQTQLEIHVQMRFQLSQLQKDPDIFPKGIIGIYPPEPLVYFLPYTILVQIRYKLADIRDRIRQKYRQKIQKKEIQLNMYVDTKDELFISIHTEAELIFYKIRRVSINQEYHQYVDCLDKDLLIDRLFNVYKITHKKFLFEEISTFIMYWLYTKKFLNQDYMSPSAIKMFIICLYISLGYGIKNILTSFQSHFWDSQKRCLEMSTTNRKGQCNIDKDIRKYRNYSIEQVKGLYIVSQKKYQIIRVIQPVLYSLGQRDKQKPNIFKYRQAELKFFTQEANKTYNKLAQKNIKLTRYSLLILLLKNMHKYFNYPNKLIFDLKRKDVMFQQNSNQFLLEIQHPVFKHVISKGLMENGSTARRIKGELNEFIKRLKQNEEAIQNIRYLFEKR